MSRLGQQGEGIVGDASSSTPSIGRVAFPNRKRLAPPLAMSTASAEADRNNDQDKVNNLQKQYDQGQEVTDTVVFLQVCSSILLTSVPSHQLIFH